MLTYQLTRTGSESLYEQLYRCIRHDIAHGAILPNEKLPSKRALSAHLGVSIITVEAAYRQLVAEGYVRSEERRGYFANRLAPAMQLHTASAIPNASERVSPFVVKATNGETLEKDTGTLVRTIIPVQSFTPVLKPSEERAWEKLASSSKCEGTQEGTEEKREKGKTGGTGEAGEMKEEREARRKERGEREGEGTGATKRKGETAGRNKAGGIGEAEGSGETEEKEEMEEQGKKARRERDAQADEEAAGEEKGRADGGEEGCAARQRASESTEEKGVGQAGEGKGRESGNEKRRESGDESRARNENKNKSGRCQESTSRGNNVKRKGELEQNRGSKLADFTSGSIATTLFPYRAWSRTMRSVLADESAASLADASRTMGSLQLRTALAHHLHGSRGMDVTPNRIVIGAGAQTLYQLLIQLLGRTRTVAVEDPGYPRLASIYRANDVTLAPIPLDAEGISMQRLAESDASIVHLMPSHQFPTGIVTSAARRRDLLNWARDTPQSAISPNERTTGNNGSAEDSLHTNEGGPVESERVVETSYRTALNSNHDYDRYLIEDDYDSDFRLEGRPIPPLQSIDAAERVIYLGSFANTLGEAFRLGYLVLPERLARIFPQKLGFYSNTVSPLDQLTLARFIESGQYERHVNRLRTHARRKQNDLVDALRARDKDKHMTFYGLDGGLHFVLSVQTSAHEELIAHEAACRGIALAPLGRFFAHQEPQEDNQTNKQAAPAQTAHFVMSYSGIDANRIGEIAEAIVQAIGAANAYAGGNSGNDSAHRQKPGSR